METVLHGHESSTKVRTTSNSQPVLHGNLQIRVSGTENRPQVSFSQPLAVDKSEPSSKEHSVITANPSLADVGHSEKPVSNPLESASRREVLSRRPSYRKILNDLSSTEMMPRAENEQPGTNAEENGVKISQTGDIKPSPDIGYQAGDDSEVIQTSPQAIQLPAESLNSIVTMQNTIGIPGIQGFTMANALSQGSGPLLAEANQGGSMWMPGSHVVVQTAGGGMQAFQIQENPNTVPGGMLTASRGVMPGSIQSPQQMAEDASRKREMRLMKNRDAAKECRRRKKEYVKCLETRVAVLEHQNKQLIDELKTLKELYVHKQVDTG